MDFSRNNSGVYGVYLDSIGFNGVKLKKTALTAFNWENNGFTGLYPENSGVDGI